MATSTSHLTSPERVIPPTLQLSAATEFPLGTVHSASAQLGHITTPGPSGPPLVKETYNDSRLPDPSTALKTLLNIVSVVKPIMARRNLYVHTLSEFFPADPYLLGVNENGGQHIRLRLRIDGDAANFLPFEFIVDAMLHELCHNAYYAHDKYFCTMWSQMRDEYSDYVKHEGYVMGLRPVAGNKIDEMNKGMINRSCEIHPQTSPPHQCGSAGVGSPKYNSSGNAPLVTPRNGGLKADWWDTPARASRAPSSTGPTLSSNASDRYNYTSPVPTSLRVPYGSLRKGNNTGVSRRAQETFDHFGKSSEEIDDANSQFGWRSEAVGHRAYFWSRLTD